jgi:FAD synthetase
MLKKIIAFADLAFFKKNLDQVKNKVLVGGCFDILHYGHITFLKEAKKRGKYLILLLEDDEFIRNKKKREPIHNQSQRAEILSDLVMVDLIIKIPYGFTKKDYDKIVRLIKPSVIAVTENDVQMESKKKQAIENDAKLIIVSPLFKNFSSKKIIQYASIFSD